MKKYIYILLAFAVMFAVSCNDDNLSRDGEGSVTFNINCADTRTQVTDAMLEKLTFRIKSVIGGVETLIRSYSGDEIKDMSIWLIPGEYKVYVEGGDKDVASFDKVYYKGSAEFTVKAGDSDKSITVDCYPDNVMIKVVFDDTIKTMVAEDKMTDVKAGIVFKKSDDSNIAAPTLDYTCVKGNDGIASSGVGYFILDNGQDCLDWSLSATDVSKEGKAIAKSGTYKPADGFKAGYVYTLKFKYSADLGGYINIVVKVDKSFESINQDVYFKPAPQFSGNAVDKTLPVYAGMSDVEYTIKAINELTSTTGESIKVMIDGVEVTDGITTTYSEDKKECTLTLGKNFTDKLKIGSNTFRIIATDNTGAQTTYNQKYVGEGIGEMEVTNAWMGAATIKAYVTNPNASNPIVYYKSNKDSDYTSVQLTVKDFIGTANATVGGGREYDYYLSYSNNKIGDNAQFETGGAIIPNGGMEDWSNVGDNVLVPYKASEQYWDCGNHGSATVGAQVTLQATGRTGSSAHLDSIYASMFGIGKFAAGNIFFGKYLGTTGTDGGIGYGKPFTFDYKPDKLVVYYKGNVGSADYAGGDLQKGDSDKSQIFVWLCNKSDVNMPYVVCTKYQKTFLKADGTYVKADEAVDIPLKDPITNKEVTYTVPAHSAGEQVEGLVAWGFWRRTQTGVSVNGSVETTDINGDVWTKIEIPLQYVGTDKPNYLVISCAASAYGDYFAGSTDSYMYVDDFEFVY